MLYQAYHDQPAIGLLFCKLTPGILTAVRGMERGGGYEERSELFSLYLYVSPSNLYTYIKAYKYVGIVLVKSVPKIIYL